jgi:hypothetical protein
MLYWYRSNGNASLDIFSAIRRTGASRVDDLGTIGVLLPAVSVFSAFSGIFSFGIP